MRPIPFDGYSWQISQHEIAFNESTTFGLLACAQRFEGQDNYNAPLNELLKNEGLLTENIRNGVASPWRDYQQVLPELGLIYSTKLTKKIKLTQMGYAFLSGNLTYEELLTLQLFKYQYPNGQKFQLGRRALENWPKHQTRPSTFIEACVLAGVTIRPALSLALILCSLAKHGVRSVSLNQILAFVLPNRTDNDISVSVKEILEDQEPEQPNSHARRNVAAWGAVWSKQIIQRK